MSLLAVVFLFLLHGLSSSGSYLLFGNKDEAFFYTTDASTYTPTPIPLSDVIPEPNEKPLIEITTPIMKRMGNISEPFEPQNHVQLPFNMPDTLDTQPSVAKSVFIPSQLENGFKPMLGQPRENYYNYHKDITNSRYDDGSGYHDKITERKSSYHPWYNTKHNPSYIPHYKTNYPSKKPYSYPKHNHVQTFYPKNTHEQSYYPKTKNIEKSQYWSSPKPKFASSPIMGRQDNFFEKHTKEDDR